MSYTSDNHIGLESVTNLFILVQSINLMNKTALVTLCRNKLFLTIAVSIELIQTQSRINTKLNCLVSTILHIRTESAIYDITQSSKSIIRLARTKSCSHISEVNRNDVGHSIISCDTNSTRDKLSTRILGILTRLLNSQVMLVQYAFNVSLINHSLFHN